MNQIQNRRKHMRYECHFPIKVILSNNEELEVSAVNISLGGIRLSGEKQLPLPVGRQVILHFKLPMLEEEIIVGAKVCMNMEHYCGLQFFHRKNSDILLASVVKLAERNMLLLNNKNNKNNNKQQESNTDIDKTATDQLLRGIAIPPQPIVLQVVMSEKNKEYPDLKRISTAIQKDISMSAAMLRAANSPAFARRQKVVSIHNAVMELGTDTVVSLVTGLSIRLAVSGGGKGKINLDHFWDECSDTAILCSALSKRFRIMEPDVAYILGLFHDVGIPLMMLRFPNYTASFIKENLQDTKEPITTREDKIFNTNHTIVGYIVGRSWALPDSIRETILLHHNNEAFATTGTLAKQVALLTLAKQICHSYHKEGCDPMWIMLGDKITELFNLTADDVEDLTDEMKDMLSKL